MLFRRFNYIKSVRWRETSSMTHSQGLPQTSRYPCGNAPCISYQPHKRPDISDSDKMRFYEKICPQTPRTSGAANAACEKSRDINDCSLQLVANHSLRKHRAPQKSKHEPYSRRAPYIFYPCFHMGHSRHSLCQTQALPWWSCTIYLPAFPPPNTKS